MLKRNKGHLTGNGCYNPPAHRMWSRDNKVHYNSGSESAIVRAIEMVRGFSTGMTMGCIDQMEIPHNMSAGHATTILGKIQKMSTFHNTGGENLAIFGPTIIAVVSTSNKNSILSNELLPLTCRFDADQENDTSFGELSNRMKRSVDATKGRFCIKPAGSFRQNVVQVLEATACMNYKDGVLMVDNIGDLYVAIYQNHNDSWPIKKAKNMKVTPWAEFETKVAFMFIGMIKIGEAINARDRIRGDLNRASLLAVQIGVAHRLLSTQAHHKILRRSNKRIFREDAEVTIVSSDNVGIFFEHSHRQQTRHLEQNFRQNRILVMNGDPRF